MVKNPQRVKQGKEAAKVRWSSRYDAIKFLSSKYDKRDLDKLMTWPTAHLITLAESFKKHENIENKYGRGNW